MCPAICQISKQVIFSVIQQHVTQHLLDKMYSLGQMFSKKQEERFIFASLIFLLNYLSLAEGNFLPCAPIQCEPDKPPSDDEHGLI